MTSVTNTPDLAPLVTPAKSTKKSVYADISLYSDLPPTPQGSGEMIVSPLAHSGRSSAILTPKLHGIREMMRTPKQQASPRLVGVRELMRTPKQGKTPRLAGMRNLLKTPKSQSSLQLAGVREMMKSPRELSSPRLAGVKNLMRTPKSQSSPQLAGLDELWKTPRVMTPPVTATTQPARRGRKRALSGGVPMAGKKRKVVSSPSGDAPVEEPLSRTTKMESVAAVVTAQKESTRGGSRRLTEVHVKAASEVTVATVKLTEVPSTRVCVKLPICVFTKKYF